MKIIVCGYSDPPQTGDQMQLANSTVTMSPKEQSQGRPLTSAQCSTAKLHSQVQKQGSACTPDSTSALLTWMPLLALCVNLMLNAGSNKAELSEFNSF